MTPPRSPTTPEEAAYVFLEQGKQELLREKDLTPLAVLVFDTGEGQAYDLCALVFTEETKRAVFEQVVALAKEKSAKAIITVAPMTFGRVGEDEAWQDGIFVTVSGPCIETVTMILPYTTSRLLKKISFGDLQVKTHQGGLNFLPGWPS